MLIKGLMGAPDKIEIRCQDAIELLQELEDSSIQLVCTDPPYGISYQSNRRKEGKSAPISGDYNFQAYPFFRETARILKTGGAAYVL